MFHVPGFIEAAFSRGEIQAFGRVTVFHGFLLLYEYFKNLTLYPLPRPSN